MLNKYDNEFRKMYEEIIDCENPLEVIKKYINLFEEDIGILETFHNFYEYINKKNLNKILNTSQ